MPAFNAPDWRRFDLFRHHAALATGYVFFANAFLFGTWVVRIPGVKADLGLSDGALGLALLFLAVGGIVAMPLAGATVARFGSRGAMLAASFAYLVLFALPAAAPSWWLLAIGLFLVGVANGAMDVAMNAQADAVEKRLRLKVMTVCHGLFSLGLAVGALPAGLIAAWGALPWAHLLGVGLVLALPLLLARGSFVADAPGGEGAPLFALPRGPLLALGLLAFCGAVAEGGVNDWTTVYYREHLSTGPVYAAVAFAAFAAAMFVARVTGDWFIERLGAAAVARYGMALAGIGFALTLGVASPAVGVVGLIATGLGVACIFPIVFRAAGRVPGQAPGPSMAAAVTLGYAGFLSGPAVIGMIADVSSLPAALFVIVLLCALGSVLGGAARLADGEPDDEGQAPPVASALEEAR